MKICFGDYTLDVGRRLLSRSGSTVHLSPKAFELLKLLVERRPNAVSKTELHQRIWPGTFVSDDSLTRLVAEVREAIDDNARNPRFLRTLHGFGYAFSADAAEADHEEPAAINRRFEGADRNESVAAAPANQSVDRPAVTPWSAGPIRRLAATIIAAAALVIWFHGRISSIAPALTRFIVAAPEGTSLSPSASSLAVSPNGRLLAFLAARPGEETRLWVRPLDTLNARELTGTEGALSPFWSPGNDAVGFFAHGQLKIVTLLGEPPKALCEVQPTTPSATWSQDGIILFSHENAIFRISSTGGIPSRVTFVNSERGETAHVLPQFLPDGHHFIYVATGVVGGARDTWIVSGSIDGSEYRRLIRAASQGLYADPGYLLFLADGALLAQPFDATRLQLSGAAMPVADADHVGFNPATPRGMFSVSQEGTLAYRPSTVRELGWFDRTGRPLGWIGAPGHDSDPALSPDGHSVAVSRYDPATFTRNIWILDVERNGLASPLTSHLTWATGPVWSPDGTRIVFRTGAVESGQLYEKRVDGTAEARARSEYPNGYPLDWSAGGLLYAKARTLNRSERDLWFLSDVAGAAPKPLAGLQLARTSSLPGTKPSARISPNGQWIAYASDISGRNEIYVRSFPIDDEGGPWQISGHGGIEPEWRRDGRELFFLGADKQLMVAPVTTESGFRAGTPSALFETHLDPNGLGISGRNQYVVTADGERFLLNQPRPGAALPPITVLLNWTAALRK